MADVDAWRDVMIRIPVKRIILDYWPLTAKEVGEQMLHAFSCWRSGATCDRCPAWAKDEWKRAVARNFRGMRRAPMAWRDYGPKWPAIRASVVARDGTCRSCGSSGRLDVHHRVPFRTFRSHEEANAPENLVALCKPCHAVADREFRRHGVVFPESTRGGLS